MNKTLATVITNLVSTIPVFGKDIVELIYKISAAAVSEGKEEFPTIILNDFC